MQGLAARHIFFEPQRDPWIPGLIFAQQIGEKCGGDKSDETNSSLPISPLAARWAIAMDRSPAQAS